MKRIFLGLLALLLVLAAAGCGYIPDQPTGEEAAVPAGRYVEEQLSLPASLQSVKRLERAGDGALYLFGSAGAAGVLPGYPDVGPWELWRSQDDGSTWSRQDDPWLKDLEGASIIQAALAEDNTFTVIYRYPAPLDEWFDEDSAFYFQNEEWEEGEFYNDDFYLYVEDWDSSGEGQEEEDGDHGMLIARGGSGKLEPLDILLPWDQYGLEPVDLLITGNGNLVLVYPFEIIYADGSSGEVIRNIRDYGQKYGGEASERDGILYLTDHEKVLGYSLEEGRELGVASSPITTPAASVAMMSHGHRVTAVWAADSAVYYCDDGGLYRTPENSPVTELLLGGEQSVLGMPTMIPHQLLVLPGDRYLVWGENGAEGNVLYRYAFDPDVPVEPSTILQVYSLRDNSTIRQAMGVFQRDVPAVKVDYRVGYDESTGITVDDALRVLSTEILAGSGPDVLVLDGMPVETYVGKDLLLDLNGVVESSLQSEYLDNIAETYRMQGKLYAIPARFTVPMLLAPESAAEVGNLQDLADWLEAQDNPTMKYTYPTALFQQFYGVEHPALFGDGNTLDEEEFASFLRNLTRLARSRDIYNELEGSIPVELDGEENAVAWAGDIITFHVGELNSLYSAAASRQALEDRGGGIYRPLGDGVYIPRTVLGIRAGGSQVDLAVQFVETALSANVLSNDFRDGLPVHREALERATQNPNPTQPFASGYSIFWDDRFAGLDIVWPEDSFFTGLLDQLSALDTPVHSSFAIEVLMMEQVQLCLAGDKTPEDAARDLKGKADLMAAEQG